LPKSNQKTIADHLQRVEWQRLPDQQLNKTSTVATKYCPVQLGSFLARVHRAISRRSIGD
jgi:hypothetical protein